MSPPLTRNTLICNTHRTRDSKLSFKNTNKTNIEFLNQVTNLTLLRGMIYPSQIPACYIHHQIRGLGPSLLERLLHLLNPISTSCSRPLLFGLLFFLFFFNTLVKDPSPSTDSILSSTLSELSVSVEIICGLYCFPLLQVDQPQHLFLVQKTPGWNHNLLHLQLYQPTFPTLLRPPQASLTDPQLELQLAQ
ncbi:hypothetical protein QQ045_019362 [Rhodiola kirilowii]